MWTLRYCVRSGGCDELSRGGLESAESPPQKEETAMSTGTPSITPLVQEAWFEQIVNYLETLISTYQISVMLAKLTFLKAGRPEVGGDPDQYTIKRRLYRLATQLLVVELHERVRVHGALVPLVPRALESMPARLRDPFLLYVERGYTFWQIARELRIRPSTVEARISYARTWLGDHYFIPDPEFEGKTDGACPLRTCS